MAWFKRKKGKGMLIQEAVEKGLVTFELEGAGGGVTSKINLHIKNLTNEPLDIEIPLGTTFSPTEEGKRS